jgi:DNA mismatch endonuclease, patch repair protein
MADIVSPAVRSRMMAGIRAKNTKPEMVVRRGLHKRGFRFRLHVRYLPGKPDLVFPKYNAVVFVNGCFWYGHECALFKWPKTNEGFWREKIGRNKANDRLNGEKIAALGWRRLTVWECALRCNNAETLPELFDKCENWLKNSNDCLELEAR